MKAIHMLEGEGVGGPLQQDTALPLDAALDGPPQQRRPAPVLGRASSRVEGRVGPVLQALDGQARSECAYHA